MFFARVAQFRADVYHFVPAAEDEENEDHRHAEIGERKARSFRCRFRHRLGRYGCRRRRRCGRRGCGQGIRRCVRQNGRKQPDRYYRRQSERFDRGKQVLRPFAFLHADDVDGGHQDDRSGCVCRQNDAGGGAFGARPNVVCILGECVGHRANRSRANDPQLAPGEKEADPASHGPRQIDVVAALLRIGGGQFGIAQRADKRQRPAD